MIRILILALLLLNSCSTEESEVAPAFYHWKTNVQPGDLEKELMQSLEIKRLYVKFFDVDWDAKSQQAVPLAIMDWDTRLDKDMEVVPTIFITNRVFQQLPIQEVPALAAKIEDKLFELTEQAQLKKTPEIQIDCDWTAGTREPYFRLLSTLHEALTPKGIELSATIRLHQIRYPEKTGIPPLDRGMLMFYNMGEVRQWEEKNSILNLETASPYLTNLDEYDLLLDLALPLFRWGVLFREGEMIRLINGMDEHWLEDRSRFYPLGGQRYEVVQGTFLDGTYLYEGDFIRLEGVDSMLISQAVDMLKEHEWPERFHLSFYHLDSSVVAPFNNKYLKELVRRF